MALQGYVIVFGSLAAVLALIVGGAFVGGPWGHAALATGILGALGWLGFILWLARALSSDI